jgi:hypothetical protein
MGMVSEGHEGVPEAGWDTESLGEFASDSIFEYRGYARSGREATPEAFSALVRAGLLLSIARPRIPDPAAWAAFLKQHDISRLEASDAFGAHSSVGMEGNANVPSADDEAQPDPEGVGRRPEDGGPSHPDDRVPVLLTITRVNGVVERLVDDLPRLDLSSEPKDAINREIDQGIATLTKLKGGIAR